MKRRYIFLTLALALVLGEVAAAKKKVELKPIGIRLYHFEIQGRTAPVAVWYPAQSCAGKPFDYNKQVNGTACLDAEIDRSSAPYPLIVFSHGLGGCGYQSVFYLENLARAGYVVAAMDHKDAAMCVMEGKKKISTTKVVFAGLKSGLDIVKMVEILFKDSFQNVDHTYRIGDIKELIDQMLELNRSDKNFTGLIDPQRIGATGHSLGGFTTLALTGAEYDCVSPSKWPDETCKMVDDYLARRVDFKPGEVKMEDMTRMICCLPEFKGEDKHMGDPRISAALALAPAILMPEGAMSSIKMPVMIITGEGKMELPFDLMQRVYDELQGPKYLLHLKHVDHMTISDVARRVVVTWMVLPGFRSHYQTKKQIYENFSRAFFDGYFKHDAQSLDYIQKEHYRQVQLQNRP